MANGNTWGGIDKLEPLPSGLRQLVGRRGVRQRLREALESAEVAVIAIRAAGGTGKSVLVREWLGGLNADMRTTTRAFAWQFVDKSDQFAGNSNDLLTKITSLRAGGGEPRESRFLSEDRKAKLLLDWYRETSTILVLDNLETLQGRFPERPDQLLDAPIKQFLTELACFETGNAGRLVVVTTRQPLPELDGFPAYRCEELPPFTPEEGAQLLRAFGITGSDQQLREASRDYGGNALALVLLAGLILAYPYSNDINYREEIRLFEAEHKEEIAGLDHAERVLYYYQRSVSNPEEGTLLRMMGLFHRPMTADERALLLEKADFTAVARDPTVIDWQAVHTKLEQVGLLTRVEGDRVEWDCHPLVRERFREDFRKNAPEHWRQAHRVLFDYFPRQAKDPARTRKELIPLYRAIHHGCLAGAFAEALQGYMDRIMQGPVIAHGANELGAISEDSAALRMFFRPNSTELLPGAREQIDIEGQAWLQARTAFCLTSLGRLNEAIHHRQAELEYCRLQEQNPQLSKQQQSELRKNTANAAGELSALLLLVGDIVGARETADQAIRDADESGDWGQRVHARCRLGAALHMHGDLHQARVVFEEAAAIRCANETHHPTLSSDHGYLYRRLLLDDSDGADYGYFKSILTQAEAALDADRRDPPNVWLVAIGLDLLSKAAALSRMSEHGELQGDINGATSNFHEAEKELSDSGTAIHLPELQLEWARFARKRGLPGAAEVQVNRAMRDAKGYRMPLSQADAELLKAELLLDSAGDPAAAGRAREALDEAERIIRAHGYGRRAATLAELKGRLAAP